MRRHLATATVLGGLVGGTLVGTAGVAIADDTCNAYSSTCPSPSVSGLHLTRTPSTGNVGGNNTNVEGTNASRLPFTGGEITLMVVAGAGAIGAGAVFVATGRRRRSAAH